MSSIAEEVIDEEIRQLVELKRMASNPRMVELMKKIAGSSASTPLGVNGGSNSVADSHQTTRQAASFKNRRTKPSSRTLPTSGLTELVANVAYRFGSLEFTIPMLVEILRKEGHVFAAKKPRIAVYSVVKRLEAQGKIEVVNRGDGNPNTPFTYKNVLASSA